MQMTDIYLPLLAGATVHFAQPDALKVSISESYFVDCHVSCGGLSPPTQVFSTIIVTTVSLSTMTLHYIVVQNYVDTVLCHLLSPDLEVGGA